MRTNNDTQFRICSTAMANDVVANVALAADRPELIPQLGEIYWREWGDEPGREDVNWWIREAAAANGRTRVPVSFLAVDADDRVLGGVALAESEPDAAERNEWSPWATGVIVRADCRGHGVGHVLMAALDGWVRGAGIEAVWVLTGGARAVAFYESCGWTFVERATYVGDDDAVVLCKRYGALLGAADPSTGRSNR